MIRVVSLPVSGLADLFERVYWPRKVRGRSANNLRLYRNALANFDLYLGRRATLDDLDDELVSAWSVWFLARHRKAETANKNLRHLLALWRYAAKKRYVEQFPTVDFLPEVQRIPLAWLKHELHVLFESAQQERGEISGTPAALWWYALLLTIWYTGERIGAVLSFTWKDFDRQGHWLLAPAEIRKGGQRDKAFRLPGKNIKALEALRVKGNRYIFQWPWKPASIYHYYNRILTRAGLPTDRMSKFHRIRRSMASYLKAAGGDPTEALDHSNASTTKRYYLDPRVCGSKGPSELLFDPTVEPPPPAR